MELLFGNVQGLEGLSSEVSCGNGEPQGGSRPDSSSSLGKTTKRGSERNRVLMFGRIRELALYRAAVLRDRGFEVLTPASRDEAVAAIRKGGFDIAVLTYTLSNETVQELSELIREYCPECPLVAISSSGKIDREIRPDEMVNANDGPAALIAALRRVSRPN
jgi:hypothetical protein